MNGSTYEYETQDIKFNTSIFRSEATWKIVVDDGFQIHMYGKPPTIFKRLMYKFLLGWKIVEFVGEE